MENQDNNNLSELEQLKAQYETLKQQFDQQEIVNDRLMKSSIKRNVDFYMRYRWKQYILYPVGILAGLLVIKWEFGNNLSLRLFWMAYCLVGFAIEIWMLRKLHVKTIENNDLLTLFNQARDFKKLFSVFTILNAVPMLILFVGLFSDSRHNIIHLPSLGSFLLVFCIALVIFVSVGIAEIRHKTKPCNEIIRQIEASETTENKKTGFDKKQKWFCIAMFVAFLGLDVWAYMFAASYLKLPPLWHNVEYVRAADDFATEGKLEFWNVDADTLAFNSTVIDGKPIIQRMAVTIPRKIGDASVPMIVQLTPEASQLWFQFTSKAIGHRAALYLDGVEIQDWLIPCGIDNGCLFIMKEWSSKEELEAFCEQLVRQ